MAHRILAPGSSPAAPPRPDQFDVILFGRGFDWEGAYLPGRPVWEGLPVRRVRLVRRHLFPMPAAVTARRLLIPLREKDVERLPRRGWGLVPTAEAMAQLGNKHKLVQYLRTHGLAGLSPASWLAGESPAFPLVIKRTNLHAGRGIRICATPAALAEALADPAFAGNPHVLQAFIAGPEFTLHAIVAGGALRWHAAYETPSPPDTVRRPAADDVTIPVMLDDDDLARFTALLAPLRYDGPVNIDFKRDAAGRVQVLEVNPRFGGSLFRLQNQADLKAAFATLIEEARWLGPTPGGPDAPATQ